MRQAENQRVKAEQDAKDAADKTAADTKFQSDLGTALGLARTNAQSYVTGRGLNYDEFSPAIENELSRIRTTIPDRDPNVGQYFNNDIAQTVLNNERDTRRDKYTMELRPQFTSGWESSYYNPQSDDSIIDSVINDQIGTTRAALDRAHARGTLNDQGFNAAVMRLGEDAKGATSTANTLGQSVIDRYTTNLRDIGTQALNTAGAYELGDTFDPTFWTNKRNTAVADAAKTFEGDIRTAVGGQQYFDPMDYINIGGTIQGTTNGGNSGDRIAELLASRNLKTPGRSGAATWASATV